MSRSRVRVPLPAPEFEVEIDVVCFDRFFMRVFGFLRFSKRIENVDVLKCLSGLKREMPIKK